MGSDYGSESAVLCFVLCLLCLLRDVQNTAIVSINSTFAVLLCATGLVLGLWRGGGAYWLFYGCFYLVLNLTITPSIAQIPMQGRCGGERYGYSHPDRTPYSSLRSLRRVPPVLGERSHQVHSRLHRVLHRHLWPQLQRRWVSCPAMSQVLGDVWWQALSICYSTTLAKHLLNMFLLRKDFVKSRPTIRSFLLSKQGYPPCGYCNTFKRCSLTHIYISPPGVTYVRPLLCSLSIALRYRSYGETRSIV